MKARKNESIPAMLKTLWREGFFQELKNFLEILNGLAAKGHNFPEPSLRRALQRACGAKGFLTRKIKNRKPCFIQKHPISSVIEKRAQLFEKYDLHPDIKKIAFKQFQDGYFKEAIQNALVEVIDQVKIKANHPKNKNGRELDGDDLMNHIFGCDNQEPQIKFNEQKTSLDKAEQRGLMNLFKGIVGIRDRKAHLNFVQNDPLKTIEYLSLASLLMRLLDENTAKPKKK